MIPIYAGFDPREEAGYHAFTSSLLEHASVPFTVTPLHDPNLDEGHVTRNRNRGAFHITIARDTNPKGAAWAGRMRREGC